jgi:thiamine pyrophosphokinase
MFFMARAIIFANGVISDPLPNTFQADDWIIAADGGARHCLVLNILPHFLIGDFDSLEPEHLAYYQEHGCQLLRYPTNKNETDLELALLHAIQLQPERVIVYGALGARWDMTLANLMLLTHPALQQSKLQFIDGYQEISLLVGPNCLTLQGQIGDTVSLIPLSGNAGGISTQNLEYSLCDGELSLGTSRGVSNSIIGHPCVVSLSTGLLVVIHIQNEKQAHDERRV